MKKIKKPYISVRLKFIFSLLIICGWEAFSCYIANIWAINMTERFPPWLAFTIAFTVAILPGIMIILTWCGVTFDKPREYLNLASPPDITILIPVYNGEKIIAETLSYIAKQEYNGKIIVNVIDNNSTDNTKKEIQTFIRQYSNSAVEFHYCFESQKGKFHALNNILPKINTDYVITIDDDTLLWKNAVNRIVSHIVTESETKKVGAVAGAVMVRNSRENLLTKMQEWDYFMSMSGLKRSQTLFSSTLVAQGAFSIYNTQAVKEVGGWPDAIVEDMVLSWDMLAKGYLIQYEPEALCFTIVPTKYKDFMKQRIRWSRGPIECARRHKVNEYVGYSKLFIALDYLMMLVDYGIILFWVPGLIAALFFHDFLIVGWATLLMLPITIFLYICHFRKQKKYVFDKNDLKVRKNYIGVICFTLYYYVFTALAGCIGYIQELCHAERKWK